MQGFATPSTSRLLNSAILLGSQLLAFLILARPAVADTVLATGDELPGLGRVQQIIPQVCVSPDGGILTTVRGEDGRSAFVCSDGSGSRVVLRSGDPEPTGRIFYDLQYGSCSFTRDGHVIFSATTLRPVVGSDGQVQLWEEAAIYRAGTSGITRMLGTGDQTSEGTVEIFSSVHYVTSSAGAVLALTFAGKLDLRSGQEFSGSDQWFVVGDTGIALAFPNGLGWEDGNHHGVYPGIPALTGQGEFLALGIVGDQETGLNALIEWTTAPGRVVATDSDLASDGFPYGEIRDGWENSWPFGDAIRGNQPSIRDDTIVFGARVALAGRHHQTRFFRYTPGDLAPQLVYASAAPGEPSTFDPWIIDSNANGDILLFDGTTTMYVARAGQALQSIYRDLGPCSADGCPGIEPVGLTDGGVVFSYIWEPTNLRGTLETDLGTAAGTSCALLPMVPPDASPTPTASSVPASPAPTETVTPGGPPDGVPSKSVCVGDCNGDGIVTVGELTAGVKILLGNMPMSMCPACEPASGGPMTVDVMIRAVGAALGGCP